VLGEFSFSAEKDTVTSAQALANPFDERVTIESKFLAFPPLRGVVTDSHFARRDRMGRLLVFLARIWHTGRKDARGIGIDEGTCVLIEPDGVASVVGKSTAYFIRPLDIGKLESPISGAEYEVQRVQSGGKFEIPKWRAHAVEPYRLTVTRGELSSSAAGASVY
jgi:cyanophycinase-like exopeptidase